MFLMMSSVLTPERRIRKSVQSALMIMLWDHEHFTVQIKSCYPVKLNATRSYRVFFFGGPPGHAFLEEAVVEVSTINIKSSG